MTQESITKQNINNAYMKFLDNSNYFDELNKAKKNFPDSQNRFQHNYD